MASNELNSALDDALALEKVAAGLTADPASQVGPYCVFDDFRPTTSPSDEHSRPTTPIESRVNMEDPMMSTEFPFGAGMRAPWLGSAAEDLSLVQSGDSFPQGNWEEWMRWDPNAQTQNPPSQDIDGPGPVHFLKPETKSPHEPHSLPPSGLPRPAMNNIPFTFGEGIESSPAFHFNNPNNNNNNSPSVTEPQQNGSYFSPNNPVWNNQQAIDQADSGLFSPLSIDQQQMQSVPQPPQSTPSLHHSPSSVNSGPDPKTSSSSQQSSPEPVANSNIKKRKSSTEDDSSTDHKGDKQPPVKKTAHNMIEKRYRTNLNDKIAALRDSVPSLRVMSRANGGNGDEEDDPEDLEGLTPAHKLNKATVLSKATEYIRHLEKRNKRLNEEVDALKARLESYDKFAMMTPNHMANAVGTPDGMRYQEDPFAAAAARGQPVSQAQGMIPVPESITNLQAMASQPHYASQQNGYPVYTTAPGRPGMTQQHMVNGRRGNSMMNKLMVGSLAGLMIVEGWREREESGENPEGRGLFALPLTYFGRYGSALVPKFAAHGLSALYRSLPLLKLFLVLAAVVYLVIPVLDPKSKPRKKAIPSIKLQPAPSPASPVEVRRKAWLTAIQTVWVPRHNFFLEAAAVCLKALKLSLRNVVSWDGYVYVTGTTKDQEAARVKAWEIALDAQLTGGDAEISKGRLILTIMASGTLPNLPARLMLKAMHIRILLWEIANAGYGSWYMFDEISSRLAQKFWNKARNALLNGKPQDGEEVEKLPDHLAALLELECNDVMVDKIVQRAYNLAWNKPSAQNTEPDEAMDSVVEDFAISSPLDALAAWYSSYVLNRALARYLESNSSLVSDEVQEDLSLAARTAPPNSVSQVRSLVAKSILLEKDRNTNILAAFDSLPSQPHIPALKNKISSPRALLMNVVGEAPIAADVRKSLTLVKCLALAETFVASNSDEARMRATFVINNTFLPEASLTLLSFVAAHKVLRIFSDEEKLLAESRQGLERIASSMRVWIGREAGRRSGLSSKTKGRIVEACLSVSKMLVGMQESSSDEGDAGYASQSDAEAETTTVSC
ncbi:putative sterol regulatory element binding protein sre1 protein [Neofusicoccum parvum UCRNP2]|uniref:Putative sterol regulatory element binding protein sre1 protein n=1 Tax=Botryosphaeria parva (strain UCR-NP2) TaxID=1287680 RepID=R1GXN3_BOTPV|nr:putative sterol regulatory element binding protein sre1 protein [Neofusicoccum parvum UCRNP2]